MELNTRIEEYNRKLLDAKDFIKEDLISYFKKTKEFIPSSQIQILEISDEEDIEKITYGIGFYIILTDHIFKDNKCTFQYKNFKAIYRGHSYFIKKRLLSHLANKKYKENRKSNETNYQVCLKIEDGISGININDEPYKNWKWMIIVYKMNNSSVLIREQAEQAFDDLYERPFKSKK